MHLEGIKLFSSCPKRMCLFTSLLSFHHPSPFPWSFHPGRFPSRPACIWHACFKNTHLPPPRNPPARLTRTAQRPLSSLAERTFHFRFRLKWSVQQEVSQESPSWLVTWQKPASQRCSSLGEIGGVCRLRRAALIWSGINCNSFLQLLQFFQGFSFWQFFCNYCNYSLLMCF